MSEIKKTTAWCKRELRFCCKRKYRFETVRWKYSTKVPIAPKTTTARVLDKEREYFRQKQPKQYQKVVYEEESDSETEIEES